MKLILRFFLAFMFISIFTNMLNAQTTYTASVSGKWSTMVWSPVGIPGPTDNVIIPDADTVTFDQKNIEINDLTVGNGASGVFQFSKVDTTSLVVNGNILIQAGATFKAQTNTLGGTGLLHTLDLKGNLTHNGIVLDFRSGTSGSTLGVCNLTLSGTTNSAITINTPYSTTNGDFNAVTINKTGGAKVILGSNIFMSGGSSSGPAALNSIMTFVSGIIETGPYVWVCQTSTELNVTGYSNASYVSGAFGRGMSNSTTSTKNFPVGDAGGLRTFNLHSTTSGVSTGHYAFVRCVSGPAGTTSSLFTNGIDKVSHIRYYQVGFNHGVSTTPSMSFDKFSPSYGLDDGVVAGNTNLRVAFSVDTAISWNGINQSTPHTTDLTNPPTRITPDSLAIPIVINSGNYILISLANATGGENPLPVELSSFTSNVNGSVVNLNWTTTTEKNNKGFDIERKVSDNNWTNIGYLNGMGTTLETSKYVYSDDLKNITYKGLFSYRLRQVNLDGTFSYLNTINVNIDLTPNSYSLSQNYPNPFNPSTIINYQVAKPGLVTLKIYNVLGKEIATLVNENKVEGFYEVNFDASKLANGIYIYQLNANDYSATRKMILLK